ncbi:hypothetical protein PF010_g14140 [Phytophthora fragariae]|uniref:Uncharacterized protein n=2 Tax=Phytophthora fragariae TaxID=53985 RepID=A0A6G0KXQ0_9STRA|nr:hypothetical protein PF010_g14140 [Phytophthora fragariae]KAE9353604.1 hypothetical protein PF008_g4920 [Phytophthora fragariae]
MSRGNGPTLRSPGKRKTGDDEGDNMRLLERAVHVSMAHLTQKLVTKMKLHARDFVNAAVHLEDMRYGK